MLVSNVLSTLSLPFLGHPTREQRSLLPGFVCSQTGQLHGKKNQASVLVERWLVMAVTMELSPHI